jgi:hypothetical protein
MNDFVNMKYVLGKLGLRSKIGRVQKAQRTSRVKNAQLEMIGLVIIVIIVITALLIFLVYKLSNPTRNIQRIYMNNEIATNLLLSMNRVNVEECPGTKLGELIVDCARPTPSMHCSDYTSCEIASQTIYRILNSTLFAWDMSFRLSAKSQYYPDVFINFDNRNCTSRVKEKIAGFALLPLYPADGSVEMKLDICTKR